MATGDNITGTGYANTEEGVTSLLESHRNDVLMRERDRVAAKARHARGDYGIELSAAHAALRGMRKAGDLITDDLDDALEATVRAIRYKNLSGGVTNRLDRVLANMTDYVSDVTAQLADLAETVREIKGEGKE